MPSHFSTIGFPVGSEDDMYEIANRVAKEAEVIEVSEGAYLRWSSNSGAEIWLQTNRDGDLTGMVPHFAGMSRLRAGITARVTRLAEPALDGAFHAWAEPVENKPDEGAYPFVFDSPDFRCHLGLKLPCVASLQVAAFAHEIEIYDTVDAFEAAQTGESQFASQFFIPSGLFSPDGDRTQPPEACGILAGHVVQTSEKRNDLSGQPFHWALVDSYGGSFDVVIDPELLDAPPRVGGVLQGSFWLSALIL